MSSVNAEVRALWPIVEYWARKFNGVGGSEFDDLVQEGAIAAWLALEEGHRPSNTLIQNAMKDYIRYWSHRGLAYEAALPS